MPLRARHVCHARGSGRVSCVKMTRYSGYFLVEVAEIPPTSD